MEVITMIRQYNFVSDGSENKMLFFDRKAEYLIFW